MQKESTLIKKWIGLLLNSALLWFIICVLILCAVSWFAFPPFVQPGYRPASYHPLFTLEEAVQRFININTAPVEELQLLPGIGEVRAQAIVEYRNENGPFLQIEEIMNVKGIGEKIFDGIKDSICI